MKRALMSIIYFFIALIFILPFAGIFFKSLNVKMWSYVLESIKTYESLLVTLLVAIIAVVINILIGTPLASVMAREKFKGKVIIDLLIVLPLIIPTMISTMGLQFAFIKMGIIETTLGVGIVHSVTTMPYYIQSMKTGYKTLNKDYVKLGKILGAGPIERFLKIELPMIRASFLVGISLVLIISLSQYLVTFIIGGGTVVTLPILMMPYLADGDMNSGTVFSVIYVVYTYLLVYLVGKLLEIKYRKRGKKI